MKVLYRLSVPLETNDLHRNCNRKIIKAVFPILKWKDRKSNCINCLFQYNIFMESGIEREQMLPWKRFLIQMKRSEKKKCIDDKVGSLTFCIYSVAI